MNVLIICFQIYLITYAIVNCNSACNNLKSCGECFGFAHERCVWCAQNGMKESRCQSQEYYDKKKAEWCKDEFIYPRNYTPFVKEIEVKRDKGAIVQFTPSAMSIKVRPGESVAFNMTYKRAQHFPLDVYFLMDLSYTMRLHIDKLKQEANKIFNKLKNFTNNVHFGFGSFIDKPGFPYYDKNKEAISYSFKNHQSLTSNLDEFEKALGNITLGGNYDDPEAGLDALMQVMACHDDLKWRNVTRRIIILFTDNVYHSAGDGKFVGAVKPNDMRCHLKDNFYSESLVQDYPSISQINKQCIEGNYKIIFAVIKTFEVEYTNLAKSIQGAAYAELKINSNITQIVVEAYLESVETIELTYNRIPDVHLNIDQDCTSKEKRNCKSTQEDLEITIPATVKIQSCLIDSSSKQTLTIRPFGLDEKLIIEIESDCQCDCEKSVTTEVSDLCSSSGYLQCGICKCKGNSYGSQCQCSGKSSVNEDLEKCKNQNETVICSGRGTCRCGQCDYCKPGFSGAFCEFDDNSCPKVNNDLCGGTGICRFGKCDCADSWSGDDCSCPLHNTDCRAPYSKEICSGNGKCECGVCICDKIEGKDERYSGAFCDYCIECDAKRCKELEAYVFCRYTNRNNAEHCDQMFNNTSEAEALFVNKTVFYSEQYETAQYCQKVLDDGSFIPFKFYYRDGVRRSLQLIIQEDKELPPKPNIALIVGSCIGAVLLIGLLTLIAWKILTNLYDTREYNKFVKEAKEAGYDVSTNPCYEEPAGNYVNPLYRNS